MFKLKLVFKLKLNLVLTFKLLKLSLIFMLLKALYSRLMLISDGLTGTTGSIGIDRVRYLLKLAVVILKFGLNLNSLLKLEVCVEFYVDVDVEF